MSQHFKNKEPMAHVLEKKIEGALASEAHGRELPGRLAAALDACRETAILLLLLSFILFFLHIDNAYAIVFTFGLGWVLWKMGRSGWIAWSRLERLNRLVQQEKSEIENHRPQEREELLALYRTKGLEGKLLTDVVDVLMADQNRLLKVMLEEEMGLTLQTYEHPLQHAMGAGIGSFLALSLCGLLLTLQPPYGIFIAAFLIIGSTSFFSSLREGNEVIPAIMWNLSLGSLSLGAVYFLLEFLKSTL